MPGLGTLRLIGICSGYVGEYILAFIAGVMAACSFLIDGCDQIGFAQGMGPAYIQHHPNTYWVDTHRSGIRRQTGLRDLSVLDLSNLPSKHSSSRVSHQLSLGRARSDRSNGPLGSKYN